MKPPERCMNYLRYDENVINRHLNMLEEEPKLAEIYRLLSEHIHLYETTNH